MRAIPGVLLRAALLMLAPWPAACGQAARQDKDVPAVEGPLAIKVVYPGPNDRVDVLDSSFVFGSVGDGRATLTINGQPARVARNGGFIGWIEYPAEWPARLVLVATRGDERATTTLTVKRRERFRPGSAPVWIDTTSFSPRGRVWWPRDEPLPLSARAVDGARVELVLPSGGRIRLAAADAPAPVSEALRAFDRDTLKLRPPRVGDRYQANLVGVRLGASLPPVLENPVAAGRPAAAAAARPAAPALRIEAIKGRDTARAAWPLAIALLDSTAPAARLDDRLPSRDPRLPESDSMIVGRAHPGASYHWFFPTGTVARVTGRINDDLRLSLSRGATAWVAAADARPLPADVIGRPAIVGSITMTPLPDRVSVRIPVGRRVPYQVDEQERTLGLTLYGATADINWLRYGSADTVIRLARWRQTEPDEVELIFDLATPVWGYRARWDRGDLIFDIRRPPAIDRVRPLSGRLVVVDAGHPPAGSTGPTGLAEPEANLAIAKRLRSILEDAGATVVETRPDDRPVELGRRGRIADSVGADVVVSIHNNAIPDGVNPFANEGTSVFYFHPRSLSLARAAQRRLVEAFETRDLGVVRGDLALARPTWMPAILTEGLFLMLPEHEALLREEGGQRRYADAVKKALEDFFRERSRRD